MSAQKPVTKAMSLPGHDDIGSYVSQFYRRDVNITDDQGDIITQESLATDFGFTARKRAEKYSFGSRVVAGYLNDFRDNEDNDTRVSSLYFDLADSGRKYFVRAGSHVLLVVSSGVLTEDCSVTSSIKS